MIAVDWGTSSFRAYRLDATGRVLAQRSAAAGLLACQGRFEAVLVEQLAGWDDATVLMAGMVGSRSGWAEAPYVPCPAGIDALAAGLLALDVPSLPGRRVFIAPGMSYQPESGTPEVMRGEETQVLGLLEALPGDGPHTVCLPGTHSKWVQVERGRITGLHTAMTGELYALLRQRSLLAALMPPSTPSGSSADDDDTEAFARGVAASAAGGGLVNHLFGVRAQGLFGQLAPEAAPSYLSGLLIGHEILGLMPQGLPACVHLVGEAALCERYRRALSQKGTQAELHDPALGARGLWRLAQAAGLPL